VGGARCCYAAQPLPDARIARTPLQLPTVTSLLAGTSTGICSALSGPRVTHSAIFWSESTDVCVRGSVNPRAIVRLEELGRYIGKFIGTGTSTRDFPAVA
jgi:hypothetical protein